MRNTWPYLAIKNYLTNDLGFDKEIIKGIVEEHVTKIVNGIVKEKFESNYFKNVFESSVLSYLDSGMKYSRQTFKDYVNKQIEQTVREIIKEKIEITFKNT